ncbi:MAG: hypothetical protein FVQ80_13910 [Planctomycetes bacterium]|nr:hypothetical protein [Planctomycetota bacterium]
MATNVTLEHPITHNTYVDPWGSGNDSAGTVTHENNASDGDWNTFAQVTSNGSGSQAITWHSEDEWVIPVGIDTVWLNLKFEGPNPYVYKGHQGVLLWDRVGDPYLESSWLLVWGNESNPPEGILETSIAIPAQYISNLGEITTRVRLWQKHSTGSWSRLYETSLTYVPEPPCEKIIYSRDGDIYVANTDGSDETQITNESDSDMMPSISPDGTTIAFSRDSNLYLMDYDGTNQRLLVSKSAIGNNNVHNSDWTLDGEWIYFSAVSGCCSGGLYKVRPDGTGLALVKSGYVSAGLDIRGTFGDKVIFSQRRNSLSYSQNVRITDLDGGNEEHVTGGGLSEGSATFGTCWSPDGQRFAYNYGHQYIYVANYPAPYNPVLVKTFGSWTSHSLEWLNNDTLIWIDAYDSGPMHTINVDTLVEGDLGINGGQPYVGQICEPAVSDYDGDGIPDEEDSDDDNDGFNDWLEELIGTDPVDEDSIPDLDDIEETTISIVENLALKAGVEKSFINKVEKLRQVADDIIESSNQAIALMKVINALYNSERISFDDLHTLKSLVIKFLPLREGVYSYEIEDGYIYHQFIFNEEQMIEMAESPFKAQPYANYMIDTIWTLSDGMGSNLGKFVGRFTLAFKTSSMARSALQEVPPWDEMGIEIRSRTDEEGKWALEFLDDVAGIWKKLTGK